MGLTCIRGNTMLTDDDKKAIADAAFALECIAHLQNMERMMLPIADRLRGLLAKLGEN